MQYEYSNLLAYSLVLFSFLDARDLFNSALHIPCHFYCLYSSLSTCTTFNSTGRFQFHWYDFKTLNFYDINFIGRAGVAQSVQWLSFRLNVQEIVVRLSIGVRKLVLVQSDQTDFGAGPSAYSVATVNFSPEEKQLITSFDLTAKIKN